MCCSLLFKVLSAPWVLLNGSPLAPSASTSHPPQPALVIWLAGSDLIWAKSGASKKSNRLEPEVPPRLFDPVCSCCFWEWEIVTAGVLLPGISWRLIAALSSASYLWFLFEVTDKHRPAWRGKWQGVVLEVYWQERIQQHQTTLLNPTLSFLQFSKEIWSSFLHLLLQSCPFPLTEADIKMCQESYNVDIIKSDYLLLKPIYS